MSIIELNEEPIEARSEIFSKDGANIATLQTLSIGSPGGSSTRIENGATIINDGTNDRVLMGKDVGGFGSLDYGIKVSQDDEDVKDASDDNLVMSSAFNLFKLTNTGTASIPASTPTSGFHEASVTVTHSLGYYPSAFVFADAPGVTRGYWGEKTFLTWDAGSSVFHITAQITYYVNTTQLIMIYRKNASFSAGVITFRYYLGRELGN